MSGFDRASGRRARCSAGPGCFDRADTCTRSTTLSCSLRAQYQQNGRSCYVLLQVLFYARQSLCVHALLGDANQSDVRSGVKFSQV